MVPFQCVSPFLRVYYAGAPFCRDVVPPCASVSVQSTSFVYQCMLAACAGVSAVLQPSGQMMKQQRITWQLGKLRWESPRSAGPCIVDSSEPRWNILPSSVSWLFREPVQTASAQNRALTHHTQAPARTGKAHSEFGA